MDDTLRNKVLCAYYRWCGNDGAPGHLTWEEVKAEYGLSPEEARFLAGYVDIFSALPKETVLEGLEDDELDALVCRIADQQWLAAIKAAKSQA